MRSCRGYSQIWNVVPIFVCLRHVVCFEKVGRVCRAAESLGS